LRDKERESRIGSSANEHTPLHEILSSAPARGSRTARPSTPDPRDSDPLHTPLIVAPHNNWSDNVRSQYTDQLNKLHDAHRFDDGPTAAQITSAMSWDYEVRHRREGEDSRRQAFAKKIELIGILSATWADRLTKELDEVLRRHPFCDD
jgi:hypothetical protein